ncbi:hypothetical protein AGR5A_Cc90167 [Agrobacterium genomosp. 5 str. CFBP 6626]|nr:hypothetical protein AGR5A_Cc90167 [Agrobacterium genomosp. 5 str. CFBP 6626]
MQNLLRHPSGAKQPVTLGAVADGYVRFGLGHHYVSFSARSRQCQL